MDLNDHHELIELPNGCRYQIAAIEDLTCNEYLVRLRKAVYGAQTPTHWQPNQWHERMVSAEDWANPESKAAVITHMIREAERTEQVQQSIPVPAPWDPRDNPYDRMGTTRSWNDRPSKHILVWKEMPLDKFEMPEVYWPDEEMFELLVFHCRMKASMRENTEEASDQRKEAWIAMERFKDVSRFTRLERLQDLLEWMKVRVDAELEKEAPPVFCPEMIN